MNIATDLNVIATANYIKAFAAKHDIAAIEAVFSTTSTPLYQSFNDFGKNRDKGMLLFLVNQAQTYTADRDVLNAIQRLHDLLSPDKKKSVRENLDQMVDVRIVLEHLKNWFDAQLTSLSGDDYSLSKAIYIFSKNMSISLEKGIKKINDSYLLKKMINQVDQQNMGHLLNLAIELAQKSKQMLLSSKLAISPMESALVTSFQQAYEAHHQNNATAIKFCHQAESNLAKLISLKKLLARCQSENLASFMGVLPKDKEKQAVFVAYLKHLDPASRKPWDLRYKEMKKKDFTSSKLFSLPSQFKKKKLNASDLSADIEQQINHLCENMASDVTQKELLIQAPISDLADLKDTASLLCLVNTLDLVQQKINQIVSQDNTWVGRWKIFLSRIKHFGFFTPREKLATLAAQYNHSLSSLSIRSLNESEQKAVSQLLTQTQVLLDSTDKPLKETLIANFTLFKSRLDTLAVSDLLPKTKPSSAL